MSSLNIKKGGFPGVRSSERFTGSNFRFRFQNCLSAVVAIFSFPFFLYPSWLYIPRSII